MTEMDTPMMQQASEAQSDETLSFSPRAASSKKSKTSRKGAAIAKGGGGDDGGGSDLPPFLSDGNGSGGDIVNLESMYRKWYLEYASYVILDRAVPYFDDGLKPVQRRILHSMWELDDGRYNKVANIIGHTMKYHPHGDAAIGDAITNLGQKNLLIDTQGNWGNPITGDSAAAPRYIEARLSKFAKEVVFNPEITNWQLSYDGRNKEPIKLPLKFPILLVHGVEGIAVGLATKIMPHNFKEICEESIKVLQDKKPNLVPDFPSGGVADFSDYNGGLRGGKIKVRSKIEIFDKKTLKITEIPPHTTTSSLIESIINANDKNKIKIKKIEDNTASDIEILVHLPTGESPHNVRDALFAFTDCETSISPNSCIVKDGRPTFMKINDILKESTWQTRDILKCELELKLKKLSQKLHFAILERLFIEKRIYRVIEPCETWEEVISEIEKGLKPYKKLFVSELTRADIEKLTEIKMKRLSRFDSAKAEKLIKDTEKEIKETKRNIKNIIDFTIAFYQKLLDEFGAEHPRRTQIKTFTTIAAKTVVRSHLKVYMDAEEGFVGTNLKKAELLFECSPLDELIAFTEEGFYKIFKPEPKMFIAKNIIHVGKYTRGDENCIFHFLYKNGTKGDFIAKRCPIVSISRNKTYNITKGKKGTKIYYMSCMPGGESEIVDIIHRDNSITQLDFSAIEIKGKNVIGMPLDDIPNIKKVEQIEKGESTLGKMEIYYDKSTRQLNAEGVGEKIGKLMATDSVLAIYKNGDLEIVDFDLNYLFGENIIYIGMYNENKIMTAVYLDGERSDQYAKRFKLKDIPKNKRTSFITDHADSKLMYISLEKAPVVQIHFTRSAKSPKKPMTLDMKEHAPIRTMTALGQKLSSFKVAKVTNLEE